MTAAKIMTLGELFARDAAERAAQFERDQANPALIERRRKRIDEDIARGDRDADGNWIWDRPEPTCDDCGETADTCACDEEDDTDDEGGDE